MKKIYLLLLSIFTLGMGQMSAQCTADFQYFGNNLSVNFVDSSSYSPNSFILHDWSFGDGNRGFGTNPQHTYSTSGTYTVCLTISDSLFSCFDTICKSVTVTGGQNPQPCMANFTYNINPNNNVDFFSSVSGGTAPYLYNWDFSTGTVSALANPTYSFGAPGTYLVTLTVTDANGMTCSFIDSVTINTCSAFFTYTTNSNGTVNFTNQSNPLNAAFPNITWDFGDGNFSNTIHTSHTYASSGTYIVTLNYVDSLTGCSASYSDSLSIQIGNPNSCNASYTIAKDSTVAFGVILRNTSSNFASHSYTWNFGDGTTGSGRTPVHQYQSFGAHVVCLTITDSILNCTSTFCDTVSMDSLGNLKTGFGLRVLEPLAVGIKEIDNTSAINIYPNPATNQISVDLRAVENTLSLQVMDLTGKVVLEKINLQTGNIEALEISHLKGGLYFMVFNDGTSQKIEKFIKQ